MTKTVAFMPRRLDSTRAQFQAYYEGHHTPLALRYFHFDHYVRNHLVERDDIGFDCLSEFWQEDIAEAGRMMTSEVGVIMKADEDKFANRSTIRSAISDERLIRGGPRMFVPTSTPKLLWFLDAAPSADIEALISSLAALPGERVTLDVLSSLGGPPSYAAIVSVWGSSHDGVTRTPLPTGWTGAALSAVVEHHTAPELLSAYHQPAV